MVMGIPIIGTRKNWFRYFEFEEGRETPSDIRNILLIIFTLVAAVTFQAGVNPPGGVWQETSGEPFTLLRRHLTMSSSSSTPWLSPIPSLSFSPSLTSSLSTLSMAVTYASAIFAVSPGESVNFRYVLITAASPFAFTLFVMFINSSFVTNHLTQDAQPQYDSQQGA